MVPNSICTLETAPWPVYSCQVRAAGHWQPENGIAVSVENTAHRGVHVQYLALPMIRWEVLGFVVLSHAYA
jgi:hypothetical protein